jgi:hypothetical protein
MVQVTQLQQQAGNYAVDTGSVNAYAVTLSPAPASLSFLIGVPIRVQIANTNTGASTLTVNGLASTIINNVDGTAISANQIKGVSQFIYDGTKFELVGGAPTGRLIGAPRYITSTQTYTPTPGTNAALFEYVGGGGAGGGSQAAGANLCSAAPGGGGGGFGKKYLSSGFAGITLTIGAGGIGVGGAAGGNGGTTSVGAFCSGTGGIGGIVGSVSSNNTNNLYGFASGGTSTGGDINCAGYFAQAAFYAQAPVGGAGGGSPYGPGAPYVGGGVVSNGILATNFGSGGSGGQTPALNGATSGGNGAPGLIVIYEYS